MLEPASYIKLFTEILSRIVSFKKKKIETNNIESDLKFAKSLLRNGEYAECISQLKTLQNILGLNSTKDVKIRILNMLGECNFHVVENDEIGFRYLIQSLEMNNNVNNREYINSITCLVNYLCKRERRADRMAEVDKWLNDANGRINSFNEIEIKKLNEINMLFYAVKSDIESNILNSTKAIDRLNGILIEDDGLCEDARLMINRATILVSSNDPSLDEGAYEISINLYIKALELLDYENDSNIIVLAKLNLAKTYTRWFEFGRASNIKNDLIRQASSNLNDAIDIAKKLKDITIQNEALMAYGDLYRVMYLASRNVKLAEIALSYYDNSMVGSISFHFEARIKMSRGAVYLLMGAYECDMNYCMRAIENFNGSLICHTRIKYSDNYAILKNNIGKAFQIMFMNTQSEGYKVNAISSFNEAISVYNEQGAFKYCDEIKKRINEMNGS